jgi:NodT family efflux transporter outer membrane factor (OMF) lipoprotein
MSGAGRSHTRAGAALLAAALSACAHLDPPSHEDIYDKAMQGVAVPAEWSAAAEASAFRPEWIGFREDAELAALIDEAIRHNPDLRAAGARLEQVRLQMRLAGADLLPNVVFGAKYSDSLQPASGLDINGFGIALSWELDLWGRARAEKKAGEATYRSAEADYVFARQSLAATTTEAWLLAIEATRQNALAGEKRKAAHEQAGLVAHRETVGRASRQDVAVASAEAHAFDDIVWQTEQARQQALRALELLAGRYPAASIAVPDALPGHLDPVPAGVPADLIERRPDIVAARERYEAAFFNREEARAARLPRLALNAGAGHLTSDYVQFKDGLDSTVFPLGAKLVWPLFNQGRLQTAVYIADQKQQEAAANYAKTILVAFGEVENALAADTLLEQRERALTAQVDALRSAVAAAETQYRVGKGDQYGVLQEQLALIAAEGALLRVAIERRTQRVNLYLALGGDFGVADASPQEHARSP